jgi:hypothetical protein
LFGILLPAFDVGKAKWFRIGENKMPNAVTYRLGFFFWLLLCGSGSSGEINRHIKQVNRQFFSERISLQLTEFPTPFKF